MQRYSIRQQLALSYAIIAFLTALALGLILRFVLERYYSDQERAILTRSARSINGAMNAMDVFDDLPTRSPDDIEEQLKALAFLSQTRIQFLDIDGKLVADSGPVEEFFIAIDSVGEVIRPPEIIPLGNGWKFDTDRKAIFVDAIWDITGPVNMEEIIIASDTGVFVSGVGDIRQPANGAPVMFSVVSGKPVENDENIIPYFQGFRGDRIDFTNYNNRSDESVSIDVYDNTGGIISTLIVSEGPSIGSEIIDNVTIGWLYAGGIAVILAALTGWFISRRVTTPLFALTATTEQMSSGNLSARTTVNQKDEVGRLASAFNEMAGRIENMMTALQRFVADAAHEFHTPLTALRTDIEIIHESHSNKSTTRALSQIQRLQSLADNLLNLSRVESQGITMSPVDLKMIVNQVSVLYASQAEQSDITLDLDIGDDIRKIQGNQQQLEHAIGNLLDNAIKFTPKDGKIIVCLSYENNAITLRVEDTGIGIPEQDLSQLFSRFHRGRNAASYDGSGLGLAIAKAIVEAHNGTILAQNNIDAGAKFTISLPCYEPATKGYETVIK